mgnify:CR=1 FL=1
MDGWLNKKIFDGYFGFKIVKLNELYNEDIVKEIKSFFDKESLEIDDISDTLVNSRSSLPHFANWFKEEVVGNKGQVNYQMSEMYQKMFSEDIILDDDGKLVYSYTYIKRAFKYIHNSAWTPFEIDKIVQIQDLCLTVEPSLLTNHIGEDGWILLDKNNLFVNQINQISTDAIRYLYNDDLNDYDKVQQHLNIIPRYGMMGTHTDDTNGDDRDYTIIIYLNTEYDESFQGELIFDIPTFGEANEIKFNPENNKKYAELREVKVIPNYLNVVVMNHQINDNIAGLVRHRVSKNLNNRNRYSLYTTYRKK